MQGVRYSDVNMGQQSEDRTSVPWWMNVQWCRVELCVGRLTCILCNCCWMVSFSALSSFCISACNRKPLPVRKLRLSHNTESYRSNKLLNHRRMSDCCSTFLVHNMNCSVLIQQTAWYCLQGFDVCQTVVLSWCIHNITVLQSQTLQIIKCVCCGTVCRVLKCSLI